MKTHKPAYALATILVLLGVAMFSIGGIITISTLESKIARSQKEGVSAYYAAEAGIQYGLWQLNYNDAAYHALVAGNLNLSYSKSNFPVAGQGFTVNLISAAQGGGYGTIVANGYSANESFTANRQITIDVFRGTPSSQIGSTALFSGTNFGISNGNVNFHNGSMYSGSSIKITGGTLELGGQEIQTPGTYSVTGTGVVNHYSDIASTNVSAPAAPVINAPSFSFNQSDYPGATIMTASQFLTAISNNATLNGLVTYVTGAVSTNNGNTYKNKTLTVNGMLIINGSLSINNTGFTLNVNDQVNGNQVPAGIFAQSIQVNQPMASTINGVMYTSGALKYTSTGTNTINGAMVAGGDITLNVGTAFNINYDPTRAGLVFPTGGASSVQVQHWEEEY